MPSPDPSLTVIVQDGDRKAMPAVIEDDNKTVVIGFSQPDQENPFDWRPTRKWITILTAELYSMLTAVNATSYGEGSGSMQRELHCSNVAVDGGTSSYLIVCAFAPLLLAPISEKFGRRKMMLISSTIFTLCYIPQALATDIATVIVFRGIQGAAASAANSLVGGVIADVFQAETRGLPMTILCWFIFVGQGLGALVFGWVETGLGFRWIAWINMILAGVINVAVYFLLQETRGSAILEARACRLSASTGILHLANTDDSHPNVNMLQLIKINASRPILFLLTEPIVLAMSLWAALVWSVVFMFFSAIPLVYAQYNFSVGASGSILVTTMIGGSLGIILASYQDYLYDRDAKKTANGRAPPESRLYAACVGGLLIPISLFWFAWTGKPSVHWMVPTVALVLFNLGVFPVFLATFSYLADSYEQYGSSAIAAQSFMRNLLSGVFPLFTTGMYNRLGYPEATSLLAALASAFSVLPFLLMIYGARIRKRSRVARQIALQQDRRAAEGRQDLESKSGL